MRKKDDVVKSHAEQCLSCSSQKYHPQDRLYQLRIRSVEHGKKMCETECCCCQLTEYDYIISVAVNVWETNLPDGTRNEEQGMK